MHYLNENNLCSPSFFLCYLSNRILFTCYKLNKYTTKVTIIWPLEIFAILLIQFLLWGGLSPRINCFSFIVEVYFVALWALSDVQKKKKNCCEVSLSSCIVRWLKLPNLALSLCEYKCVRDVREKRFKHLFPKWIIQFKLKLRTNHRKDMNESDSKHLCI